MSFRSAATAILIVVLAVAVYDGFYNLANNSTHDTIYITVNPNGDYIKNFTVSCYGCVAEGKYVWQGVMQIGNASPLPVTDKTPNSTAVSLHLASLVPITPSNPCRSGFYTGSTCVYPVDPFPFAVTFNIQKTSTGGILEATIYLYTGGPLIFQTTSGSISKNLVIQRE